VSIMTSDLALSEPERLVYEIIRRETELHGGVFQVKLKEFAELRHLEPQQIARIVSKLVKQGLVKRKLVDNNGRSMYFLQAVITSTPSMPKLKKLDVPIELSTVIEIPCFTCKDLYDCVAGGYISPHNCPKLTKYLLQKIRTSRQS